MPSNDNLIALLNDQPVQWLKASDEARNHATDTEPALLALQRAEQLWGVTDLSQKFRELLKERDVSLFDYTVENHFTGSAIVLDPATRRVLLTFHPWYQLWLQLGGHDEGENDPVAISAREAWEESGIEDLWICDWPVRIDPHPAEKCKSAKGAEHNWHYDMCYMVIARNPNFTISDESVDMRWFSIEELKQLVAEDKAQQRALEMAENSLLLYDALAQVNKLQ